VAKRYAPERLISYERLWPIWRPNDKGTSALEGKVIRDICLAEQNTQRVLKENGLCDTCNDGECLPPYSLVFFARLTVGDSTFSLSCAELATEWDSNYEALESELFACVEDIKASYDPDEPLPESCPRGFSPTLVDEQFSRSNPVVQYTSTIFLSTGDLDGLWEKVDEYDRAENSDVVTGVYDTQVCLIIFDWYSVRSRFCNARSHPVKIVRGLCRVHGRRCPHSGYVVGFGLRFCHWPCHSGAYAIALVDHHWSRSDHFQFSSGVLCVQVNPFF